MPTLRQQCKQRFKIAFDSVRVISGTLTFILVVDQISLKTLSSTIKMMQLINYGINSIQKLQLKRKKFKKMQAVYLIHPDNYKFLLQDFDTEGQPQYHSVHVISLTKIPPYAMKQIGENLILMKRLKTLKQLNLNFTLFSSNQVKLLATSTNSFSAPLLTELKDQFQTCVANTVDQLTTILTSMSIFYIVQIYYNKSPVNSFSEKVALGLKDNLQNLFKIYEKNNTPSYDNGAPLTIFLILDRTFDPLTPIMKDFHYGPMLYDYKNIQNHKCSITKNKETKTFKFDENDQIMEKYRALHFATTLTGLQKDFESFTQTHTNAKFQKTGQKNNLSMAQMSQMLKTMPKYAQSKDKYGFHIEMLSELFEDYEKNFLKQQGDMEQTLALGTTQNGKKVKDDQLLASALAMAAKLKIQDQIRIYLICLMTLQLKYKQQNSITQILQKRRRYVNSAKNLKYLTGNTIIKLNPRKSKNNLILDRYETKIQEIVRDISGGGQANLKFFRVGRSNTSSKPSKNTGVGNLGRKKIGLQGKQQTASKPRLVVFIASSIGYNEMRSLAQYQSKYQIIYVSHNFFTSSQYVRNIASIFENDQL